jgi:hypothetical protein
LHLAKAVVWSPQFVEVTTRPLSPAHRVPVPLGELVETP